MGKIGKWGKISVSLQDEAGNPGKFTVKVPSAKATDANAKKAAEFCETYSNARVTGYGFTKDWTGDNTTEGKYDMCLQRLEMLYETGEGDNRRCGVPAPKDSIVNDYQQPESDFAEDCKDFLNTIGAGSDWVYNGGGLKSRMPKKSARAKEMTGI